MALPLYLAMTAAEIRAKSPLPPKICWMACHFSPYATGLSNCPNQLPPGSMLILNDRTPICGHDPGLIAAQLGETIAACGCECVLLDFQRPGVEETAALVRTLAAALPCPVGISEYYIQDLSCPVFLPPVPPDTGLAEYLAPWQGREIWLEAALGGLELTLTEQGCAAAALFDLPSKGHPDTRLHCHYSIKTDTACAKFHLWRTREDLDALLADAESLGITRAIGLWQELG